MKYRLSDIINLQVFLRVCVFLLAFFSCISCAFKTVQKDISVTSLETPISINKPFIVEVNTIEKNTDVVISIIPNEEYAKFDHNHICNNDYVVSCGDGKLSTHTNTESIHCFFATSGVHDISIFGKLHGIRLVDHKSVSGDHPYYFTKIKQWGTIPWHDLSYFADGCKYLKILALDAPNLTHTKKIDRMFSYTQINANINHWDVSEVESMHGLFMGNEVYNQPMDKWNTSKVFNMSNMFEFATSFNQPIGSWDVSSVTNMMEMFYNATNFNQPLDTWNVTRVKDMTRMFLYANAFVQDISKWDFSGIKHCLTTRESSEQNCITYIFSYSNINLERKEKYGWLETMFEDEYVLCNIDDNDCSLYGD